MGVCQVFRIRIPAKITPYISPTEQADIGHAFCLFMCLMPIRGRKTRWYLGHIIFLSLILFVFGGMVHGYLEISHREYQDLVLISGVIDSLKRVRTGDYIERHFKALYEVRLTLQGDQHLYVVNDIVYPALDWEKFNAKEYVGSRVSLRVERAHLVSKSLGRLKPLYYSEKKRLLGAVDVYGLESSRGIYQTPEDSLKELRGGVFIMVIFGAVFGLVFLWYMKAVVDSIRNPPMAGPHASSKSFRRRIDTEWR